jgi:dihydrofolate synthase / folylpolyglutamate synthase
MTYAAAIEFLSSLGVFGAKPGLENIRRLTAMLGSQQDKLRIIHVAGTNGKGSTCAMLESIYRAAGLRVGLFTSPHLVSFNERMQVNRVPASEDDVVRLVREIQPLLEKFPVESHPTFFEVVTAMALRQFADRQCDLVVWETGLGGRLDATNIVTPLASVITNIGLDHQQWLGDTHEQIAAEKAGIIKPGVPVITAAEPGRGLEVIAKVAHENDSLLTVIDRNDARGALLDAAKIPLVGEHQRLNGAVAVATVRAVEPKIPISQEAILNGLSTVYWPGRMQLVTTAAGQQILLDGAHNIPSAQALAAAFREQFREVRPTMILGVLSDKDWRSIAEILAPLAGRLLVVPVSSHRSLAPSELASACRNANPSAAVDVCDSLAQALQLSARDPFLLITGSLYLIGEAMERLQLLPVPPSDERGLNEWNAKR